MRLKIFSILMVATTAIGSVSYSNTRDYRLIDSISAVAAKSEGLTKLALYDTIARIHPNTDSVLKYATFELELAQKLSHPTKCADAFRHMGIAYSYKWNIDKAYENMTKTEGK